MSPKEMHEFGICIVLISFLKKKVRSQAWWYMLVIPATGEAAAGGS